MKPEQLNAAIFILTQNNDVRRTYLKTCLYFLFRHFNAACGYPVVILHEGDYDATSQREVIMSVRPSCRSLVSFRALDEGDFTVPEHIDEDKMRRCIATKPTPYWRDAKYRMMCRWWLVHFPRYAAGYDYVMRLDDDAFIEEPVPDLFRWVKERDLVYSSGFCHIDCGMCNYGMKDLFLKLFPDRKAELDDAFIQNQVPSRSVEFHPFRLLLSMTQNPLPIINDTIELQMPKIWYNNFFITKTDFWHRPEVQKTIDAVDKDGSIFYMRFGDAPLQTLILLMHAKPEQVARAIFKYSKRMQREAFKGDNGEYYSYMPLTYDKSSCVISDNAS